MSRTQALADDCDTPTIFAISFTDRPSTDRRYLARIWASVFIYDNRIDLLSDGQAGDRARTGDIQLGRLALYQLSYTRARLA
jgi:hypothetical protein